MKTSSRRSRSLNFLIPLLFATFHLSAVLAQGEGTLKFSFEMSTSAIRSSPALGDDGVVYFGSDDDKLYAVNPDGSLQWSYDSGANIEIPPIVGDDGTIYIGNNLGQIHALNPDGTLKWMFDSMLASKVRSMALAADGTLYAGIGTATAALVYALNPDGTVLWTSATGTTIQGISIGAEGVILAADGRSLHALNPLGQQIWDLDLGPAPSNSPAVDSDGTMYLGANSTSNSFFAVNSDGTLKWEVDIGRILTSPAIGADGTIYVPVSNSATDGALVAVDPSDGSELWRFVVSHRVQTTPAVGRDGTIYIGTDTHELYAVNPDGMERWVFEVGADVRSSPNIAPDGTVYFGSHDSTFYALRSASVGGLAASPWASIQGDTRNTGRGGQSDAVERWFAAQVFKIDDENTSIINARHTGGAAGNPTGRTANFKVKLYDREGTLLHTLEDQIEPGHSKNLSLDIPDLLTKGVGVFIGAAVIEASPVDAPLLAFFLTWQLGVSDAFEPFRIGVFFSKAVEAALIHHFPAESSARNGLGIAIQNIGDNDITCNLAFYDNTGSLVSQEDLNFMPLGSLVSFFDDRLPDNYAGGASLACDAPTVVNAVNQDLDTGFPTDVITDKAGN